MNKPLTTTLSLIASVVYRIGHVYRHFASREIWRQFRLAGARYDTSAIQIAFRALRLYRAGRFTPEESLTKGLVDPSLPLNTHEVHFSEERLNGLQDAINSPNSGMCRDKLLFHTYCSYHALPITDLLGLVSPNGSRTRENKPLISEHDWVAFIRDKLPASFIVKPRTGNKGRDVKLMGMGTEPDKDGATIRLAKALQELAQDEDYLLEKRIEIHGEIARLTGSAGASCVRVVTVIDENGAPRVMGAYLRLIVGNSVTDNISDYKTGGFSGNVLAVPDLGTGVIVSSLTFYPDRIGCRSIDQHPVTELDIIGFQVPMWDAVCTTVCTAAAAFLPIRTIGWDVVVTPDGPVLVEANERYQYAASGEHVRTLRAALRQSIQKA